MSLAAKTIEALGIACVMIGLVEGILSETMWMELYLGLVGVCLFLVGRRMEKARASRDASKASGSPPAQGSQDRG